MRIIPLVILTALSGCKKQQSGGHIRGGDQGRVVHSPTGIVESTPVPDVVDEESTRGTSGTPKPVKKMPQGKSVRFWVPVGNGKPAAGKRERVLPSRSEERTNSLIPWTGSPSEKSSVRRSGLKLDQDETQPLVSEMEKKSFPYPKVNVRDSITPEDEEEELFQNVGDSFGGAGPVGRRPHEEPEQALVGGDLFPGWNPLTSSFSLVAVIDQLAGQGDTDSVGSSLYVSSEDGDEEGDSVPLGESESDEDENTSILISNSDALIKELKQVLRERGGVDRDYASSVGRALSFGREFTRGVGFQGSTSQAFSLVEEQFNPDDYDEELTESEDSGYHGERESVSSIEDDEVSIPEDGLHGNLENSGGETSDSFQRNALPLDISLELLVEAIEVEEESQGEESDDDRALMGISSLSGSCKQRESH